MFLKHQVPARRWSLHRTNLSKGTGGFRRGDAVSSTPSSKRQGALFRRGRQRSLLVRRLVGAALLPPGSAGGEWGTQTQPAPVSVAVVRRTSHSKCRRGCGERGALVHCWWDCKLVPSLWTTVRTSLRKLRTGLPHDPAIPLLGGYPRNLKTFICEDLRAPMFTAALFTISKRWKQPKCPSVHDRIKKRRRVPTVGYGSAVATRSLPFATVQTDLEIITLSKMSQPEKGESR